MDSRQANFAYEFVEEGIEADGIAPQRDLRSMTDKTLRDKMRLNAQRLALFLGELL